MTSTQQTLDFDSHSKLELDDIRRHREVLARRTPDTYELGVLDRAIAFCEQLLTDKGAARVGAQLSVVLSAHKDVRATDPQTSRAAAYSKAGRGEVRERVQALFRRHGPMTDETMLSRYRTLYGDVAESSPRKRRGDLVKLGVIKDSGMTAHLRTGKTGIVWMLAYGGQKHDDTDD